VPCRRVELRDGLVIVGEKIEPVATSPAPAPSAAGLPRPSSSWRRRGGNAAAEMLRREQFDGTITMLSADDSLPCDRPNLSKNYLAGSAPEEWISLRSAEFYHDRRIDLKLNARVVAIDTAKRELRLEDGSHHRWDALLLATGAEPVKLDVPGAGLPHVHVLRTWADSRALVAGATKAKKAVIVGASFIGLEVASSLRARDIVVQVFGRETVLMERVLGRRGRSYLRRCMKSNGVGFIWARGGVDRRTRG